VILHLDAARELPPRLHLGPVLPRGIGDYLFCDASVRYLLVRHGRLFGHVHPTGCASGRAPLTQPTGQIKDTNGSGRSERQTQ
jgi:hypothetical protein